MIYDVETTKQTFTKNNNNGETLRYGNILRDRIRNENTRNICEMDGLQYSMG